MKTDPSSDATHSDLSSPQLPFSTDCYPFLRWSEAPLDSDSEKIVVFRSLVATVKLKSALDYSLEAKAVKFLGSVVPKTRASSDAFLSSLALLSDDYLTNFVQSIVVLLSSASQAIIKSSMKILRNLIYHCYAQIQLALVKADLLPQIITILNPQSLSFTEAVDIHFNLLEIIALSLNLATPYPLSQLRIDDRDDQQAVHETIFQQVLVPSEKYMWHLCVHRFSIIDGMQSSEFMTILAVLIQISPYYHPTMDLVLHLPIYLTLPSCLTFFETCHSIYPVLSSMGNAQWEWNKKGGEVRQIGKKIHRMLRMEGIEDVIEDKLQNDINAYCGRIVIAFSIQWNNLLGITIPQEE